MGVTLGHTTRVPTRVHVATVTRLPGLHDTIATVTMGVHCPAVSGGHYSGHVGSAASGQPSVRGLYFVLFHLNPLRKDKGLNAPFHALTLLYMGGHYAPPPL